MSTGTARVRGLAPVVAVLAGVVVVAVAGARTLDRRLPLDPDSAGSDGTRALALVLTELGADVVVLDGLPQQPPDALLVLNDNAGSAGTQDLRAYAEAGGTLVVADPSSQLVPDVAGALSYGLIDDEPVPRRCDVAALAGADEVVAAGGVAYEVPHGALGCYEGEDGPWMVIQPEGAGTIVALGGPSAFTNAALDDAHNAAVAAALLAPAAGATVGILRPDFAPPESQATLGDLLPEGLAVAVLQLLVAFAVVVAWRARRLGKPVVERGQVTLTGSELVVAVGNLLQAGGSAQRAAQALRDDLRRTLCGHLGLPPQAPAEQVSAAAARRTGLDRGALRSALEDPLPTTDAALVQYAQQVEDVRRALGASPLEGAARAG